MLKYVICKKNKEIGSTWYKIHIPIFPFRMSGKWNFWKKIRITYLVNTEGDSYPIRIELLENFNNKLNKIEK